MTLLHPKKRQLDFVYIEKLIPFCFLFICVISVIQHLLNALLSLRVKRLWYNAFQLI